MCGAAGADPEPGPPALAARCSALLAPATTQHHRQSAARRHPVVICGDLWCADLIDISIITQSLMNPELNLTIA